MGRKYISKIQNDNFIYPNNNPYEYAISIVHDINDNCVTGTTTGITASDFSTTGVTLSGDYTWAKNDAEMYINPATGDNKLFSIHVQAPSQEYFKPWRCVYDKEIPTSETVAFGTFSFTLTPDLLGLTGLTSGDYFYEMRFIGHRAIYPICGGFTIAPLPTPTPTPTGTPTPTPTGSHFYYSGATLNVYSTGYIKYNAPGEVMTYVYIGSTGIYTITGCSECSSILPGFPYANVASFSILDCGDSCA